MYSLTHFQLERLKTKVYSIIQEHNAGSEDKIPSNVSSYLDETILNSSHFWNEVQEYVRASATDQPKLAAIHEAERLINKRFKTQLEEMLKFAIQCSEALDYYSSLRYRSMLYRLTHTTPFHWVKQFLKWISSQKLKSINEEEMEKAEELENLLDEVCTRIGELNKMLHLFENVQSVEMTENAVVKLGQRINKAFIRGNGIECHSVADACSIIDQYEEFHIQWIIEKRRQLKECHVPNYLSRHWLYYSSLAIAGFATVRYLEKNYETLQPLVSQGWNILKTNINQRIIVPMREAYNILRFNSNLPIVDTKKLEDSKQTLSRMVENYLIDTKSTRNLDYHVQRAYEGQINPVMANYIEHIRQPIRGAITTPLISEMLIQLQVLQVELLKVMSGIGDVMQSNALNVELLALMPVVIFVSSVFLSVSMYQRNQDHTIHNLIQDHLLQMDTIINSNFQCKKLTSKDLGKVFYHSSCCIQYSQMIMDQIQQKKLFSDMAELNSIDWTSQQKYNVIQRMYKFIDFTRR